jgi:lactoylglutathione lyase
MDRSIDFYVRLLGLKLLSRREIPQNDAEIAFLQDPEGKGARLELTFFRKQKKFVQANYEDRVFDHIAFDVKNMDETIAKVRREGVTVTDEPYRLGGGGPLIAFIEDPDGVLIELIEKNEALCSPSLQSEVWVLFGYHDFCCFHDCLHRVSNFYA